MNIGQIAAESRKITEGRTKLLREAVARRLPGATRKDELQPPMV